MRIVVLVKEVPETSEPRVLSLETGLAVRSASEPVVDEISERALEAALAAADESSDTEVVVLTMGPSDVTTSLRRALAMGADSAVHVVDDGLVGADLGLTAEVLAAALRRTGFDLVIAGNQSTDGAGGVLPAMLAELLDVPSATNLTALEITPHSIAGDRAIDGGTARVSADLPAIISVTERMPDARFPGMKGTMAARKKPIEVLSLGDLGVDVDAPDWGRSIVVGVAERPPRSAGTTIVDEGDAGTRLAEFLVENRLV